MKKHERYFEKYERRLEKHERRLEIHRHRLFCSYKSSTKNSLVATDNGLHASKLIVKVARVAPKNKVTI
ncbi:MAG: hypothetical protein K6D37_04850 [Prevotella sp.]|nr:hypothetical protein [Prevotella sp.]